MDILYICGGKDEWGDDMLRYSLRSVERHGHNLGRVFICAPERPSFLSDEARFIQVPRRFKEKARDIMWAIESSMPFMDEEFLYSSDDHFYVRDVDFDAYPYYVRGTLPETCDDPADHYLQHLVDTRLFLESRGLGNVDYSSHCNTHFDRRVFLENIDLIHESYDTRYGLEATCLMVSLINRDRVIHPVHRDDLKIACANTYDNVEERIGSAECFSIMSITMGEAVGGWLGKTFAEKSRYEI